MPVPDLHFSVDPPADHVQNIANFAGFLADHVDQVIGGRGFAINTLRVMVTDDVPGMVVSEVAALQLHADQAAQLDPLGGMTGKTLVSPGWIPVSVVVGWQPAPSPISALQTLAHEFGHVLAIALGTHLGAPRTDPASVAESDEAVALSVADEYRAERFAIDRCAQNLTATGPDGNPVDIWEVRRNHFVASLGGLLDAVVPALPPMLLAARHQQADPGVTYRTVRDTLHDALNLLGYFEGIHKGDGSLVATSPHRAVDLMRPFWEPLFTYLAASDPVPANADWLADDAVIRKIGREGIDAIYKQLGVTRTHAPDGSMNIAFGTPPWAP